MGVSTGKMYSMICVRQRSFSPRQHIFRARYIRPVRPSHGWNSQNRMKLGL